MRVRNEDWAALDGKEKGDTITLWLKGWGYTSDFRERLAEGTVTKVTRATRTFTMPGAVRDGEIQLRAGWRTARETGGTIEIDGERVAFHIATPQVIERLSDPNRDLREALEDGLRDLRHYRDTRTPEKLVDLIGELEGALSAAKALQVALGAGAKVDA